MQKKKLVAHKVYNRFSYPMKMIKAIIFDMDGVISDTQKIHSKADSEILNRFGVKITPEEITEKYSGVRVKDFFGELLEGREYNLNELIREKNEIVTKLAKVSVEPIEGSQELIKKFSEKKLLLAVASSSSYIYVETVLNKLNVLRYFNHIITGDMVVEGKPDPEIFLTAAKRLNVQPEECLVIEDAIRGMQAARSAGMFCIGLVKNKKKMFPSRNLVNSLKEIDDGFIKHIKL